MLCCNRSNCISFIMKTKSLLFALVAPAALATEIVDPSLASSQNPIITPAPAMEEPSGLVLNAPANDAVGITFDVNVGTQGIGLSLGYEFNEYFKMRLRGAYLSYVHEDTWSDVDGEFDIDGNNVGIIADYHPFGGVFRISAGVNFSNLTLTANGSMEHGHEGTYDFGDYTFVVNGNKATVEAEYDWRNVQPYLGIGWSSDGEGDKSLYFTLDIGVNFIGKGKFSIGSTGGIEAYRNGEHLGNATDDILENAIREEGKDFFKIADDIFVYPVIQFGMGYRF